MRRISNLGTRQAGRDFLALGKRESITQEMQAGRRGKKKGPQSGLASCLDWEGTPFVSLLPTCPLLTPGSSAPCCAPTAIPCSPPLLPPSPQIHPSDVQSQTSSCSKLSLKYLKIPLPWPCNRICPEPRSFFSPSQQTPWSNPQHARLSHLMPYWQAKICKNQPTRLLLKRLACSPQLSKQPPRR